MKDSIHILSAKNSIVNHFMAELRDINIQCDRMRFRRNMERLGEVFAYEISHKLQYTTQAVTTPLGTATVPLLNEQPVLITILRAGIPLHQGLLNIFDGADSGFIGSYRSQEKSGKIQIHTEYTAIGNLDGKTVILSDPMMATGKSMADVAASIQHRFKIKYLHIVSVIASQEGLDYVRKHVPNATIWLGALDAEMTSKSYIIPGLGDAGDLCYGDKS